MPETASSMPSFMLQLFFRITSMRNTTCSAAISAYSKSFSNHCAYVPQKGVKAKNRMPTVHHPEGIPISSSFFKLYVNIHAPTQVWKKQYRKKPKFASPIHRPKVKSAPIITEDSGGCPAAHSASPKNCRSCKLPSGQLVPG